MAGHNKWSKVKRLKGALDAKRGKLFSNLAKEITLAARIGGGSPDGNPRLRSAILSARAVSMPNDNIERAVKRGLGGTGEDAAEALEEMIYEGYGPGGAALLLEAATDSKNRTAQELRRTFSKHGGNLAVSGSVLFQFKRRGFITIPLSSASEERVMETALAAGADDIQATDEHHEVLTPPEALYAVGDALRQAGLEPDSLKLTFIPDNYIAITQERTAAQFLHLSGVLEDNDDIQHVHTNAEIPEALLTKIAG